MLLLGASAAAAATRYAAPDGSGAAPCSQGDPCPLATALNIDPGDEIVLAAGTYEQTSQVEVGGGRTLRGPRPGADSARLLFTGSLGTSAVQISGTGTTLRDLTIEGTDGSTLLNTIPSSADDRFERIALLAHGSISGPAATFRSGALVRDAVIWAAGINAAIELQTTNDGTAPINLVNVTAVGGFEGLSMFEAGVHGSGELHVTATNSIFRSEGGFAGIAVSNSGAAPIEFAIDHSNYDKKYLEPSGYAGYVEGAGVQTAAPRFADLESGDLHQLPGSPTIGAGQWGPLVGAFDLDGEARLAAEPVDIGADQVPPSPPPTPQPPPATGAPPTVPAPRSSRVLKIEHAFLSPRRFAMARPRRDARRAVSRLRIRLSRAATVSFDIERLRPRRRGQGDGGCGSVRRRCTRFHRIGSLPTRRLGADWTSIRFSGRLHGRPLRPGRYRLRIVAGTAEGGRSIPRYAAFWVVARKR